MQRKLRAAAWESVRWVADDIRRWMLGERRLEARAGAKTQRPLHAVHLSVDLCSSGSDISHSAQQ